MKAPSHAHIYLLTLPTHSFVTDPNVPIDERCLAIRDVLINLEALLNDSLNPVAAACGAGASHHDEGKTPEPLWWALKQIRIRGSSADECQRLQQLIKEVEMAIMPCLAVEFG